jgi:putative DNA primase/helicase
MMFPIPDFFKKFLSPRHDPSVRLPQSQRPLRSIGFNDFLVLDVPPREMLLDPILPERSLAMLYAPRGVGKTLLSLSIGLAVAGGCPLLRWSAPRQRRVLYVDGEMLLVSLQERLRAISTGLGAVIPNDAFRVLAADNTENGLSIGSEEGQRALDPLLNGVDLVIFDNLSTLCTTGSESASDAWVPMQNWLIGLRRRVSRRCLSITQATMEGNEAHLDVRMLWIRSLPCGDLRIICPSRVHGLKCTS